MTARPLVAACSSESPSSEPDSGGVSKYGECVETSGATPSLRDGCEDERSDTAAVYFCNRTNQPGPDGRTMADQIASGACWAAPGADGGRSPVTYCCTRVL